MGMSKHVTSCHCGRSYTADEWQRLPYVGLQQIPEGPNGEAAYSAELRNCACGSTISMVVSGGPHAKRSRRTDCHRAGAIVPADYTLVLGYHLATTDDGWPVPSFGVNCELDDRREHGADGRCCVIGLRRAGARFAEHGGTGKCTACGASFVYGDVWRHEPTGEHIHLGHECAAKFEMLADRSAFELAAGRARAAALTQARRQAKAERRAEFLAANPGLAEALEMEHGILADMAARFQQWCELSPKQVALALKIANELRNPRPEEQHVAAPVSDKRVEVCGVVVSMKVYDNNFGGTLRMTVKVSTPDGVWLAWGTCPAALDCERGDTVRFTARLKKGRDSHFALFSRPTKAVVVAKKGEACSPPTCRHPGALRSQADGDAVVEMAGGAQ